jgi:hypothetical protein
LDEAQPARALQLLTEHERAFPQPLLRQEAAAARIIARCRTRLDSETKRAASALTKRLGQSPLRERVQRACSQPADDVTESSP